MSLLLAWPARANNPRDTDPNAFQRDLDEVFVQGGLTADRAAHRAARAAPLVARKVASVAASSADLARSKLSLVPELEGKATYTRLSPLDSVVIPLGPQMFVIPFLENSYDLTAQVG